MSPGATAKLGSRGVNSLKTVGETRGADCRGKGRPYEIARILSTWSAEPEVRTTIQQAEPRHQPRIDIVYLDGRHAIGVAIHRS